MKREEKDELILAALISNPTTRAAAAACGIAERQIYERLQNEEFKAKYTEARTRLLEGATTALQGQLSEAVQTVTEVMKDQKNGAQVRLNAAETIMRNSLKFTDQNDILNRLNALEKAQADNEQNKF